MGWAQWGHTDPRWPLPGTWSQERGYPGVQVRPCKPTADGRWPLGTASCATGRGRDIFLHGLTLPSPRCRGCGPLPPGLCRLYHTCHQHTACLLQPEVPEFQSDLPGSSGHQATPDTQKQVRFPPRASPARLHRVQRPLLMLALVRKVCLRYTEETVKYWSPKCMAGPENTPLLPPETDLVTPEKLKWRDAHLSPGRGRNAFRTHTHVPPDSLRHPRTPNTDMFPKKSLKRIYKSRQGQRARH